MTSVDDGNIVLDPNIRDWVLLPIFLVMFLQGMLRQYIAVLLKDEKKINADILIKTGVLRRAARLRGNAAYLTPQAWRTRKRWFIEKGLKEPEKKDEESPPQDPLAMVGMMKQNMMTVIPNMLMMGWVSFFFSGFVLVKLPFGLTDRFKSMLQRGIFLNSLNVSYVSSLSWYFINLFGLRGVFSLVLGSENGAIDNAETMMQAQMQMSTMGMAGGPGAADSLNKLMQSEKTELEIFQHQYALNTVEQRVVQLPILA